MSCINESKLNPITVGEIRLAFRSEEMWKLTLSAIQGGAHITRFEGVLLEDGSTLTLVIVWVWLGGEVEKFKEEDFIDVA